MNNISKNQIIQKAIISLKKYNIVYKQVKKSFLIDNIEYSFKNGLIKIQKLLKKRKHSLI